MTPAEEALLGAFVDAISGHLPVMGPGPEQDVRLACAAINGAHFAPAAVQQLAAALNAGPLTPGHAEPVPNHIDNAGQIVAAWHPGECITCHGTVDSAGKFHAAGAA